MSVLIKGMEMPTSCYLCTLRFSRCCLAFGAELTAKDTSPNSKERPECCPLVDVPTPHGKLIDADELIRIAKKWIDHPDPYISKRNKDFIYFLEKEDAVIEAEE